MPSGPWSPPPATVHPAKQQPHSSPQAAVLRMKIRFDTQVCASVVRDILISDSADETYALTQSYVDPPLLCP
eukprot:8150242-Alexandrium_andersonii.AAC.1